ncbi:MAG: hypothetical protein RLZZ546_2337 [Bacteroidota bacterium]|jgi:uncharacterized protein (DUF1501 family)
MPKYTESRRNFIKMAGLAGAGLTTATSSIFNLRNLGALAGGYTSNKGDYKALICLFLEGGADSFNMLVPLENNAYKTYTETRSNLALPQDQLRQINPLNVAGVPYGVHPAMDGIQNLFNQGKLCFLNNIGTLVNPITKQQFYDEAVPAPLGLFSHSDQINQWQTAITNQRLVKGWAGRMSDLLADVNTNPNISMNISFNGANTFQSSNNNVEYTVNNGGATGLMGYFDMYNNGIERRRAIDTLMNNVYSNPFKDTYTKIFKNSLDSSIQFQTAIDEVEDFNTTFSDTYLSGNMRMIAKIIAAREKLGFTRQIFFINYGGWDTHDELLDNQSYLFNEVDNAITELHQVLSELNMIDSVVTFSMSEFGRTLTSNGNGTDHAWGGNVFAMGGPVKGNNFYGQYPSLLLEDELELGGGVLIPTLANDLYFAELAKWFGVPDSDLNTVFPNIGNFYSIGSGAPIGFLNI